MAQRKRRAAKDERGLEQPTLEISSSQSANAEAFGIQ
jgi:hypothetical protein